MRAKVYEAELIAEGTLHGSCIVKSRKMPDNRLDYALFLSFQLSLWSVSTIKRSRNKLRCDI